MSRSVRVELGETRAVVTTTLRFAEPQAVAEVTAGGDRVLEVEAHRIGSVDRARDRLVLRGARAGARVSVRSEVAYGEAIHGVARFADLDGTPYVVGTAALGGAAAWLACEAGPADRRRTQIQVEGSAGVVHATGRLRSMGTDAATFVGRGPLAAHQLAFVAGPFVSVRDGGSTILARRDVDTRAVADLVVHAERCRRWVAEWFGGPSPWGSRCVQTLVPGPSWLAMEHPGCVLLSERLLEVGDVVAHGRRTAVLAHELAHQWLGNLVAPRRWADVAVFEGLAELVGQLACEALLGNDAMPYLSERRARAGMPRPRERPGLIAPDTASLPEITGLVHRAEVLRRHREASGHATFRERLTRLCRDHADETVDAATVSEALGLPELPDPVLAGRVAAPDVSASARRLRARLLAAYDATDPIRSCQAARVTLRRDALSPGGVRDAIVLVRSASMPGPVEAGLRAELAALSAPPGPRPAIPRAGAHHSTEGILTT